ncbi:Elongation factor Ts mitochondrial [Fasciola gigantica]|uniref:Elongation factor Ts, mitochondrial n=1 Tax=Fasciola gigantica TaxID=46835 RepID=A0A504YKM2_FASGI|nr:Elongation factor Ts mitochondrial [Fasciola gigantica]
MPTPVDFMRASFRVAKHLESLVHSSTRFSSTSVSKSHLSQLRRSTGYTFGACREALLKHNNDFDRALQWLNEEAIRRGWDKAEKLSTRHLSQGLLGVLQTRTHAVVIEVNCETDFVARNEQFQNLVAGATEAIMERFVINPSINYFAADQFKEMVLDKSTKLSDAVAIVVGAVGENIAVRRAVGLHNIDDTSRLASYAHISTDGVKQGIREVRFGKYAAVIRYRPTGEQIASAAWHERASRLGKQLCQHIVGMNPRPGLELTTPADDPDEEKCLLLQPFFLDDTVRVGEHLARNEIVLEEFVRLECGQEDSNRS